LRPQLVDAKNFERPRRLALASVAAFTALWQHTEFMAKGVSKPTLFETAHRY
jgi:hypothetical protein